MSRLLRLLLIAILFCFMVGGFLLLQVSKNLPRETGNELLAGKDQPDPLDKEPAADTSVPAELSEPLAKVGQPEAQGEASVPDFEFLKRMGVVTDSASL